MRESIIIVIVVLLVLFLLCVLEKELVTAIEKLKELGRVDEVRWIGPKIVGVIIGCDHLFLLLQPSIVKGLTVLTEEAKILVEVDGVGEIGEVVFGIGNDHHPDD